jgi:hypothetical protein
VEVLAPLMDPREIVAQRLALQHGRLRPLEVDYLQAQAIISDLLMAGLLDTEGASK